MAHINTLRGQNGRGQSPGLRSDPNPNSSTSRIRVKVKFKVEVKVRESRSRSAFVSESVSNPGSESRSDPGMDSHFISDPDPDSDLVAFSATAENPCIIDQMEIVGASFLSHTVEFTCLFLYSRPI